MHQKQFNLPVVKVKDGEFVGFFDKQILQVFAPGNFRVGIAVLVAFSSGAGKIFVHGRSFVPIVEVVLVLSVCCVICGT